VTGVALVAAGLSRTQTGWPWTDSPRGAPFGACPCGVVCS
jgi:hypothetical protein